MLQFANNISVISHNLKNIIWLNIYTNNFNGFIGLYNRDINEKFFMDYATSCHDVKVATYIYLPHIIRKFENIFNQTLSWQFNDPDETLLASENLLQYNTQINNYDFNIILLIADKFLNYTLYTFNGFKLPKLSDNYYIKNFVSIENNWFIRGNTYLYTPDVKEIYVKAFIYVNGNSVEVLLNKRWVYFFAMTITNWQNNFKYNDFFARFALEQLCNIVNDLYQYNVVFHNYVYTKINTQNNQAQYVRYDFKFKNLFFYLLIKPSHLWFIKNLFPAIHNNEKNDDAINNHLTMNLKLNLDNMSYKKSDVLDMTVGGIFFINNHVVSNKHDGLNTYVATKGHKKLFDGVLKNNCFIIEQS